jgi:hypothetical protein
MSLYRITGAVAEKPFSTCSGSSSASHFTRSAPRMDDEDVKPNISGDAQQSSESPPPDSAAVNRSNAEAVQTDVEMDQEQNGHDEDDEDYHEDSSDAGANLKGEDDDGEGELEDDEDESSDDEPLANTVGRRDVDTLGGMFKEKNMLPEEDFGSKSILGLSLLLLSPPCGSY